MALAYLAFYSTLLGAAVSLLRRDWFWLGFHVWLGVVIANRIF